MDRALIKIIRQERRDECIPIKLAYIDSDLWSIIVRLVYSDWKQVSGGSCGGLSHCLLPDSFSFKNVRCQAGLKWEPSAYNANTLPLNHSSLPNMQSGFDQEVHIS